MISAKFGRVECLGHSFDHRARRDILGLRCLEHAAQQGIVGRGLDPAVHHPGHGKLDLILQPEPAPAVHHPERAAAGGHSRHGPVQELDVKLVGLNVRFRQVGDLGHQLADLILRLLEQTRIDDFFRHGGTSGLSPGSSVASPRQSLPSSGDQQRTGTVNTRHPLRKNNGTRRFADFLTIFLAEIDDSDSLIDHGRRGRFECTCPHVN